MAAKCGRRTIGVPHNVRAQRGEKMDAIISLLIGECSKKRPIDYKDQRNTKKEREEEGG